VSRAPDFRGKAVLVTGASSGIGAATALAFAALGARVGLLARRRDRLEAVARSVVQTGGEALVLPADVGDPDAVHGAVAQCLARWNRVDVLVNNAGVGLTAAVAATTLDEFRQLHAVNVLGTVAATQAVLPAMKQAGSGHIINVSSVVGRRATPLAAAYSMTKFAQVAFSESLRVELKRHGIYVSVVYPIRTATEFFEAQLRKGSMNGPTGPIQSAERVARAIVRCARHPRPEVYPFWPARILAFLSVTTPRLVDLIMGRLLMRRGPRSQRDP
jgi:short-subunit dehydrogenase